METFLQAAYGPCAAFSNAVDKYFVDPFASMLTVMIVPAILVGAAVWLTRLITGRK